MDMAHRGLAALAERDPAAVDGARGAGQAVQRQPAGAPAHHAASSGAPELGGRPIRRPGIVYKQEGVNLRDRPGKASHVVKRLPFNTRLFVDSAHGDHLLVTTHDGQFGYVASTHIKTNLPEPDARIYYIEGNDTALTISRKHYGGGAQWGSDHRFFVNGLVHVNRGPGARGIYKPNASADWDETQVREGYMIWIPSLSFMRSLQGKIDSGSITHDTWEQTKRAAQAIGDVTLGTGAFIAGLLHGAGESLWDIFVGLADLAGMAWDVLKSFFTRNLLSDAQGLWQDLSGLDWSKLLQGWLTGFARKWNQDDLLAKWHFRGWVIGYAIAEVVMFLFSGGVIQGIKWVGKAAKVTTILASLPRLARFAKTIRESRAAQKLVQHLSGAGGVGKTAAASQAFVRELLSKPASIWGKGPDEIAEAFRKAGYEAVIEPSTRGSRLSKQIRIQGHREISNIQVHPGGGRHGGSYYKISTSTQGKLKIVDPKTYVATPGEKVTIIHAAGDPSGWLLRAMIANSAAQQARNDDGE